MSRSGADLALLLLGGFRVLVDEAILELAERGYEEVRPVHEFAMRAIAAGADDASELGRRLSVSKQAAAKTVAVLEERGYGATPNPGRRSRSAATPLGTTTKPKGHAGLSVSKSATCAAQGLSGSSTALNAGPS
jgi:hypothetical protein